MSVIRASCAGDSVMVGFAGLGIFYEMLRLGPKDLNGNESGSEEIVLIQNY